MKKIWNVFIAIALVGGMVGCGDASKLKDCELEIEKLRAEEPIGEVAYVDTGWIIPAPELLGSASLVANVVVFTKLSGPFTYGTQNKTYNLCTIFKEGTSVEPSKLILKVGQYQKDKLVILSNYTYDLGANDLKPYAVKWVTVNGKLSFEIGTIDVSVSDSAKYELAANKDVAIKMTDMFPIGHGSSASAIIGAEDTRAGIYYKKKVVSYGLSGISALFYTSIDGTKGTLVNVPISNTTLSTETSGHPIGVTDWNCN